MKRAQSGLIAQAITQSDFYPVNLPVAAMGIACHRRFLHLGLATGLIILYLWITKGSDMRSALVQGARIAGIWQAAGAQHQVDVDESSFCRALQQTVEHR
jgi:hypothetical protein